MSYQKTGMALLSAIFSIFALTSCMTAPVAQTVESGQADKGDLLMEAGTNSTATMDLPAARESFKGALAEYAAMDYREGSVQALLALGWNFLQDGDPGSASEYYHQARALAEGGEDTILVRDTLNHQADLAIRIGDPVKASDLLDQGEVHGDARVESARLRLLGWSRDALGDTHKALSLLENAYHTASDGGELNEMAQSAYRIAKIQSRQANFSEAEKWAGRALDADREANYPPGIIADLRALAIIAVETGDDEAAADYYRRAWLALAGSGRPEDVENVREALESITGHFEFLP